MSYKYGYREPPLYWHRDSLGIGSTYSTCTVTEPPPLVRIPRLVPIPRSLCTLFYSFNYHYHVDIAKRLSQRFSVLEESDFASRQSLQTFEALLKTILLFKVQVRLELNQRLVLKKRNKACFEHTFCDVDTWNGFISEVTFEYPGVQLSVLQIQGGNSQNF